MINSIVSLFGATSVGDPCDLSSGNFLHFPTWYSYLQGQFIYKDVQDPSKGLICDQAPHLSHLTDVWLVVAAIIEILLRVAAIAAVAFVVYAGIQYATSQGSPEKTGQAKSTLVNAVIGLAIAIMAAAIISFIAGSIS